MEVGVRRRASQREMISRFTTVASLLRVVISSGLPTASYRRCRREITRDDATREMYVALHPRILNDRSIPRQNGGRMILLHPPGCRMDSLNTDLANLANLAIQICCKKIRRSGRVSTAPLVLQRLISDPHLLARCHTSARTIFSSFFRIINKR